MKPGADRETGAMPVMLAGTTLTQSGISPTLLSLTWTQSTDAFWTSYEVDYSTSGTGGPWSLLTNITGSSSFNTEWIYDLSPGATWYWREVTWGDFFGYYQSDSNALTTTQPTVATLTFTQPTSTSVQLSWTNGASYGGNISFGEYEVNESVNGGSFSTVATVTQETTHSYTVNGLSTGTGYDFYIATVDVASDAGNGYDFASDSNSIHANAPTPLTSLATAHPGAADVGQSVSFSCVAIGGSGSYTFNWGFGDGSTASGGTVSHTYSGAGTFTGTCTVTDSLGTNSSSLVQVIISPQLTVDALPSHHAVSPGTLLYLNASTSGGPGTFTAFQWNFGDGSSSSGTTVTHTYARPGNYHPSVTVTDGNGVSVSASTPVNVSNLSITAAVTRTAGQPGTPFAFTASASGGGGSPFEFAWTFGDGATGMGTTTQHAYAAVGNYTPKVTVTDSLGGTNTTDLATIRVYGGLSPSIILSTSGPTPGQSVTLDARVSGGSGSYSCRWNFGDSNQGTGCSVAHSWATSGTYTVELTVNDSAVGNATANTSVIVALASTPASTENLGPAVGGIPLLLIGVVVFVAILAAVLVLRRKPRSARRIDSSNPTPKSSYCPKCGAMNSSEAAFCQRCGGPLTHA